MNITEIEKKTIVLLDRLKEKKLSLVLAESCTGGLVSSLLADIPGASEALWGGFICYTKEAKASMLDIDNELLNKYGLVSAETVKAMATGALRRSAANAACAITGIAGPGGDGSAVPVGTVWIAVARNTGEITAKEYHFEGTRKKIREKAAEAALEEIYANI